MTKEMSEPSPQGDTLANLYGAAADHVWELSQDAHDICVEAAPLVGDLTGKLYGYGTLGVTDSPAAAKAVDAVIESAVTRGWPDTCDLPSNLTDAAKDVATTLGEKTMPLLDNLANLFGEMVTSVRQEVVEQGWFGRTEAAPQTYDDFLGDRYGSSPDPADGPSLDLAPSVEIER